MHLAELALGGALCAACGFAVLGPAARPPRLESLLLAGATGAAVLVQVFFLAAWAGLTLSTVSMLLVGTAIGGVAHFVHRIVRRRRSPGAEAEPVAGPVAGPRAPAWLGVPTFAALAAMLALFAAKVATMPLWSWDHYVIWGAKLRRVLVAGSLDLEALAVPELLRARPDYPLGLPALWHTLLLGGEATPQDFKAMHLAVGLALAGLVYSALRRLALGPAGAGVLTAIAAASPLYWDTVAVGLAEMPLAFFAVATVAALLAAAETDRAELAVAAGVTAGFVPWLKDDGLPLAVLLAAFGAVVLVRRTGDGFRWSRFAPFVLALGAGLASRTAVALALPEGTSFFHGAALARGAERLFEAPQILASIAHHLLLPDFLGIWVIFAAAALSTLRRRGALMALAAVVVAQLATYGVIFFVTYLPPEAHIRSALPRIAAALVPLAVLVVGGVVARHGRPGETATISP